MKGRALLLDLGPVWEAAALIENGVLQDVALRQATLRSAPAPEALYRGAVRRRLAGGGAAFLTLGGDEAGYLSAAGDLAEGAAALVEIRTHPEPGKAWPLTPRVALRSRRVTLTPGAPGLNLSRSIRGEGLRGSLRAALETGLGAEAAAAGLGCVARTAAAADPDGLAEEAAWLRDRWRGLTAHSSDGGPGLLAPAPGPAALALRDWAAAEAAILPTPRSLGAPLAAALETGLAPTDPLRRRIEADAARMAAEAGADLFERFDVAGQAEAALGPRITLNRGAWAALEPTAALTALDVNSGAEASALDADLAAAAAAPRLLRIGGLGGLIAIDFIAQGEADRARVETALRRALARDPVETTILGWTRGGLMEMTRKRARRPLLRRELEAWRAQAG